MDQELSSIDDFFTSSACYANDSEARASRAEHLSINLGLQTLSDAQSLPPGIAAVCRDTDGSRGGETAREPGPLPTKA